MWFHFCEVQKSIQTYNKLANCTGTRQSPHKTAVTSRVSHKCRVSGPPPSLQTHWLLIPGGLVAQLCPTLATLWTVARQTTLSMGFPRQESRSGLPFPSPGDLSAPELETVPPVLQVASYFAAGFFADWATRKLMCPPESLPVTLGLYNLLARLMEFRNTLLMITVLL